MKHNNSVNFIETNTQNFQMTWNKNRRTGNTKRHNKIRKICVSRKCVTNKSSQVFRNKKFETSFFTRLKSFKNVISLLDINFYGNCRCVCFNWLADTLALFTILNCLIFHIDCAFSKSLGKPVSILTMKTWWGLPKEMHNQSCTAFVTDWLYLQALHILKSIARRHSNVNEEKRRTIKIKVL